MKIMAQVKLNDGKELGLPHLHFSDNNKDDIFERLDCMISRDVRFIRIALYDDDDNPFFHMTMRPSGNFDWLSIADMADRLSRNLN